MTGTSPRTRARSGSSGAFPRRGLREPVRDRGGPPTTEGVRDHDVPDRPRLRRLPAAAPRRVRRRRSRRTSPVATSRSTRWPGERRLVGGSPDAELQPSLVDPFGGGRRRGAGPAGRRRSRHAVRRGRAADGPRRPARRDARVRDRAGDARRDPRARPARRPPVGRADRGGARPGCSRRGSSIDRAAADGRHRPPRSDLAGARRPARHPPEQDRAARTSGTTRSEPSTRRRPTADRPARGAPPRHRQAGDPRGRPLPTATTPSGRELARRASRPPAGSRATSASASSHLVRNHMFSYEPDWSRCRGPAVHRQGRSRTGALDELFALREADNVGIGAAGRGRRPRRAARPDRGRARRGRRPRPARAGDRRRRPDGRARARAGTAPRADPRRARSSA